MLAVTCVTHTAHKIAFFLIKKLTDQKGCIVSDILPPQIHLQIHTIGYPGALFSIH